MKKFAIFAILACLLGGFTMKANAQIQKEDVQAAQNFDNTLQKFDDATNKCVAMFKEMQGDEKYAKEHQSEYQKVVTNAENLRNKIERNKEKLNKKQLERYENICEKLQQIYQKD